MRDPQPNLPLLRKVVEWAEAEAAKTDGTCMWNQEQWATETDCGTAFCIAGYVCDIQHDTKLLSKRPALVGKGYTYDQVEIDGEVGGPGLWCETAQKDLGLTQMEAENLFSACNSIRRVRRVAQGVAERAGERL